VRLRTAAPGPERATAGVLADAGFSAAEIRDLQQAGVAGGD
jgi:hypothetical protein